MSNNKMASFADANVVFYKFNKVKGKVRHIAVTGNRTVCGEFMGSSYYGDTKIAKSSDPDTLDFPVCKKCKKSLKKMNDSIEAAEEIQRASKGGFHDISSDHWQDLARELNEL